MKKNMLVSFICCIALARAGAQMQTTTHPAGIFALSWEIAFPLSNNYLNKTSFAGGRFEYRQMFKPNMSLGLAVSWSSFDDYLGRRTYTSKDGATAITTDMVRQIYTLPITAIYHYYPTVSSKKKIRPNIGIGLGAEYAEQNSYYNIYELTSTNWGFVVRPELGAIMLLGPDVSGSLSVSYQWSTNKNDAFNISSLSQVAINIGLAWKKL